MNTDKIFAQALANEYAPKVDSKVVALKKLDRKAKLPANICGYTLGIVSCLVFGTGMCLCMGVIGGATVISFVIGLALGIAGILGMSVNYMLYKRLLEQGKQKYAFEIMELAKEICESENA